MTNDDDDFEITIDDAQEIARRVVSADGKIKPLIDKEQDLLEALISAKWAHDDALRHDASLREGEPPRIKLRTALVRALEVLEDYPGNLALFDADLDESYGNPNSKRDLRGLLRRAIAVLDEKVPFLLDRQDQDGKIPRGIRKHPDKISSVDLRALVEDLRVFWDRETCLPFSDGFDYYDAERGEDGPLRPIWPAAILVYEAARLIDPDYTAEACLNAMRPR